MGVWLYLADRQEWRLYELGVPQITVAAAQVERLCARWKRTRAEILDWIATRPTAPLLA